MTTHSGVTGRALTRALASLSASTSLTISVGGVRYEGERLCSPYLSHQSVSVRVGDADAPLLGVLLENERFTVYAVGPLNGAAAHQPAPPAGMVWHEAALPAAMISAVTERLADITPGLADEVRRQMRQGDDHLPGNPRPARESILVRAAVALPILLGFAEDGRPVYAARPEPEPEQDTPADLLLAGITEATFSPDDKPPAPADDDPEPEPEG